MIETAEVHVWRIPLDGKPGDLDILSSDERERAARFHFERDRRRFLISHAALRRILGRYTGREPEALRFSHGPHGKPFLDPACEVRFNLSHSGEVALCAVARGREIGVDVERIRTLPDYLAVAKRFFAPAEAARIVALPEPEVPPEFFRIWTRTEAWLKATGEGIAGLGQPCPETWTVTPLDVGPEYSGALAAEGRAVVRMRQWGEAPDR